MEQPQMAFGLAARDSSGLLSPFSFSLRAKTEDDIILKILYCGICRTDLSTIKNEWGNAKYPVVPGHEIVGIITEVGCNVQKFKVGEKAGVGYPISTCLSCDNCKHDTENYCPKLVPSFNSFLPDGTKTYGGFANMILVNEHFAVRIPENLPCDKVAPLMCAGITVYTPLKHHGLNKPGMHLGVVGLGGLGHMAVKFGKACGVKVTVISTSPSKGKEAIEKLGAEAFLLSSNADQLKTYGKLIMLGASNKPVELPVFSLMNGGKIVAGSMIGGMKDTQEMLDFAGEHNITAEVEIIGMNDVNAAMERLEKGDVRYRFVIDVANGVATP